MGKEATRAVRPGLDGRRTALDAVVLAALRKVVDAGQRPRSRCDWIDALCEALRADCDSAHVAVLNAIIASGIERDDVFRSLIPEVARRIGEMWVTDSASFVDVTVAAGRLQRLYRDHDAGGDWESRTIPLGQSALMVVPSFEDHSLGAFAAASQFRKHGIWVHMAIGLEAAELAEVIKARRFSMVGMSLATAQSVESARLLIHFLRASIDDLPPVVVGGRAAELLNNVARRTGADYTALSPREAINRCGLASVSPAWSGMSHDQAEATAAE